MRRMSENKSWDYLPSVIIVRIFSYLPLKDRLNASITCKAWRETLFTPSLWPKAHFKIRGCDNSGKFSNGGFLSNSNEKSLMGAEFLANKCARFIREAIIEFNSTNPQEIQSVQGILNIISENRKIQSFTLLPTKYIECNGSSLYEDANLNKLVPPLLKMIHTAQRLRHVALGFVEQLVMEHSGAFLAALAESQAKSLESLHLASVREDPEVSIPPLLSPSCLEPFSNLARLSLDLEHVSDPLLKSLAQPHRRPLDRFSLHMQGTGLGPGTSDQPWQLLREHSPRLQVRLSLLQASPPQAWHGLRAILHPTMPLTHFRSLYSILSPLALELLATLNCPTLQSLHMEDALSEDLQPSNFTLNQDGAENPLVILAWRCSNLQSIRLVGYEISLRDIVGIARLRGTSLRELVVPETCLVCRWPPDVSCQEISQCLGRPWAPLPASALPLDPLGPLMADQA